MKFPSVARLFTAETGIVPRDGRYGPYCKLHNASDIEVAHAWLAAREHLIFLRDNLDCSVALDFNFSAMAQYTPLGEAENAAKSNRNRRAIDMLSTACIATIRLLRIYREAGAICAVPPSAEKVWDLPSELASRVAKELGLPDLTSAVAFSQRKESVKTLPLQAKWVALENGDFTVRGNVQGISIILIDDKYQSGTTAQFVGGKLLERGASMVLGLFCVKTWRDTDNSPS